MPNKKSKFTLSILSLISTLPVFYRFFSNFIQTAEEEINLAKKNYFIIIILSLISILLIISIWTCLLFLFYYYLISLHLSVFLAINIVLITNLILFLIDIILILHLKNKKLFPRLKKFFSINK